jgi:hypothetical protein
MSNNRKKPVQTNSEERFFFTNAWFDGVKPIWDNLLSQLTIRTILEIGSYEGASICYLIEKTGGAEPIEVHCIDTWEGGIEHQSGGLWEADMNLVEARFQHNTKLASSRVENRVEIVTHKGMSDVCLTELMADGKANYFDFIYIDGSHQAPDVLFDAVVAFKMLKVGGVMAFDDYLWAENLPAEIDPLRCPKPAIDAFININIRKLRVISAYLSQVYIQKLSD